MTSSTHASPSTTEQTLRQAMQDHRAGRFDVAAALYRQVLNGHPRQPDALHLSGMLQAELGDYVRAAELITSAIEAQPAEAMFHNNLGNVCMERGLFEDAKACYVRAIELEPGRIDALNNLGVLLSRLGEPAEGEKLLLVVLSLAPGFTDARQNLANHYLRNDRLDDAVRQCMTGLVVTPRNPALFQILSLAYSALGMKDESRSVCRAWVEAEPDNPVAAFHLQACTGDDVPARAPDAYVRRIFDSFSGSFDAKLAALSYKAPALVAEAVARHGGPPDGALNVLDAGCGTGLCGPLLRPWAHTLSGVDLSKGMLRRAEARGAYDELVCGELVALLCGRPAAFDLIVSADTLCYFGALDGFAEASLGALRGAGLLVFTVEAHAEADDAPDFRLQGNGRYSHRRAYVESALRGAGLSLVELQAVILRTELGAPVNGWLVSARAGTTG